MPRPFALVVLWLLVSAAACEHAPVHAVIHESFSLLDASAADEHYHHYAGRGGVVVDLGCFVVERRQLDCFDTTGGGQPLLYLAVVECTCPCVDEEADPCDATRPQVRAGTIRGLVDREGGTLTRGGVELPSRVDLSDASQLFITREDNGDVDPAPGRDVVLDGPLVRDGRVLRGELESPTRAAVSGLVTVVPVEDEVWL